MITVEVDSKEGSDDDMDFMPRSAVRSAAQAATQAMMGVPWRQRAAKTGS